MVTRFPPMVGGSMNISLLLTNMRTSSTASANRAEKALQFYDIFVEWWLNSARFLNLLFFFENHASKLNYKCLNKSSAMTVSGVQLPAWRL